MNAIDIFITTFLRVLTYWVLGFILLGLIGFLMGCTEKPKTRDECLMREGQKFQSDDASEAYLRYVFGYCNSLNLPNAMESDEPE